MKWTDVFDIAISLEDKYPNTDVLNIKFTALQQMVMSLDGFEDEEKRCNEKVLEAIQSTWLEER